MSEPDSPRPLITAGAVLGAGLGGFFDGIVFHQILQVHNMLSARIPVVDLASAKANMVFDGLFHAAVWLATVVGVFMLLAAARRTRVERPARVLAGGMLIGWGVFNLVEGVVDHLVIHAHHVVERLGVSVWDYLFLAWGAAMVAGGLMLTRGREGRSATAPDR